VSVPYFRLENFQCFRSWREGSLRSSTFRLADLLEMLPGQINHDLSTFKLKELREISEHDQTQPYLASCSGWGLAGFICRHFHSFATELGFIVIRTTVSMFKLSPRGSNVVIYLFPCDRVADTHQLASENFQGVRRFAQGQVRLSSVAVEMTLPAK
jgi:hypothetical protein